jgi:hypothetical protein
LKKHAQSSAVGYTLPDTGVLDVVLGTVAANRLEGDPVWLVVVGPPAGGKSETLNAISGLEDAHPTATLTEAALLSGTPKREHDKAATGGLLRKLGERGIIVCKDFGSVLSMNRDARALVLAALREVYDGTWTRHVGTDGGKTLSWTGRVGLIAACTPTIDRHHAVMGSMGERFTLYRLPSVDPDTQARQALRHAGREKTMRAELAVAARAVLADIGTARERTSEETDRLIALATFVVRARSAVERDGHTRDIELVPEPEAPTRLVIVLDRLLAGPDAIGCDREHALALVTKTALDSVPALRLAILRVLATSDDLDTNTIADHVRHPATTTRRTLEDLVAHHLVQRHRGTEGTAHRWSLSFFARDRLQGFPEMSSNTPSERDTRDPSESTSTPTNRETPRKAHDDRRTTPADRTVDLAAIDFPPREQRGSENPAHESEVEL